MHTFLFIYEKLWFMRTRGQHGYSNYGLFKWSLSWLPYTIKTFCLHNCQVLKPSKKFWSCSHTTINSLQHKTVISKKSNMDQFKEFFESSTIHGVVYISTSKGFSKLFWLMVIVCGFTTAYMMISNSMTEWHQSPISTSIETVSISEVKFPPIVVCPPAVSFSFKVLFIKVFFYRIHTLI